MAVITVKNLEKDGEKMELELAMGLTVHMPSGSVTKSIAQPGWKWSTHMKPLVGTELCEAPHFGLISEWSGIQIAEKESSEFWSSIQIIANYDLKFEH